MSVLILWFGFCVLGGRKPLPHARGCVLRSGSAHRIRRTTLRAIPFPTTRPPSIQLRPTRDDILCSINHTIFPWRRRSYSIPPPHAAVSYNIRQSISNLTSPSRPPAGHIHAVLPPFKRAFRVVLYCVLLGHTHSERVGLLCLVLSCPRS